MLREDHRLLDGARILATGAVLAASYAALYRLMRGHQPPLEPFSAYVPTIAILILIVTAVLSARRGEGAGPLFARERLGRELALACLCAALGYGFIVYTLRLPHLSRLFVYGGLAGGALASAALAAALDALDRLGGRGRERRRVLLVGDGGALGRAAARIQEGRLAGLESAGAVRLGEGGLAALEAALDDSVVDFALFGGHRRDPAAVEDAMLVCRARGVEVWLMPDMESPELAFSRVDYLGDLPLLVLPAAPRSGAALLAKRLIDVVLSAFLFVALAPFLAALAASVALTSPGPVLFRQRRVGLHGRAFTLLKFRSMADGGAPEDLELRNDMKGPVFKMKDDPRMTRVGRLMRKYSLDELPQLWNVLTGDMSLVGPRPPLPAEVERYEVWHRRRLSMRPGLTGLWQVNGRHEIPDFNDWVRLDLTYLDGWSLWLDLKVILKTVPVVLRGTGL
ncbi:MAG: exopolysaccharide biosynthesis polyprenyl glycosylphosphotransferase [Elusimicrobia bacterium]|nr:exopolysaccharide biosynthesis polyprenyl glycosylphosphotransferase [Elusimicrobiota bacterium]